MQQTARRKIFYPNPDRSDRPDVPAHILNLAAALDVDVIFNMGLDSDRLSSVHQVGGGRLWWATDTHILWWDDGSTWRQLGNAPLDSPSFTGVPIAPTPSPGDISTQIATTEFVTNFFPVGAVLPYAGGAAPAGWLICDGSAVSRAGFSNLFAIVGVTYGVGDGSSTFNLPDLRGRVPVGVNSGTFNVLGKKGGEETHVNTTAEMPAHNHTESAVSAGTPTGTIQPETTDHFHSYLRPNLTSVVSYTPGTDLAVTSTTLVNTGGRTSFHVHGFVGDALGAHSHTINNTGGSAAHNNLQPYIALNYLIKT